MSAAIDLTKNVEEEENSSTKVWKALHAAFQYFNDVLFNGKLDSDRVILNCSRKSARTLGFYRPSGWEGDDGVIAEISLNPDAMHDRSIDEIYSTLAHEMAHFWQDCYGTPGKRGYHNKEWADKMVAIGLTPFSINDPTKKTGMRCSHSITPDGVFQSAMENMPEEFKLPFKGINPPKAKAKTGYPKWSCPNCGQACRAKETAKIACGNCSTSNNIVMFECDE